MEGREKLNHCCRSYATVTVLEGALLYCVSEQGRAEPLGVQIRFKIPVRSGVAGVLKW